MGIIYLVEHANRGTRPWRQVFVLLSLALSVTSVVSTVAPSCNSTGVIANYDLAGLRQILSFWNGLQNLATGAWTGDDPCGGAWHGVTCQSAAGFVASGIGPPECLVVTGLAVDAQFSFNISEPRTTPLGSLETYFSPNFVTLTFEGTALDAATQNSLFITSLTTLKYSSCANLAPANGAGLTNLAQLDFVDTNNPPSQLPTSSLTTLNLGLSSSSQMPAWFCNGDMANVTTLQLQLNTPIPDCIATNFTKLQTLDMESSLYGVSNPLPAGIFSMTTLTSLWLPALSGSEASRLPNSPWNLPKLNYLYIPGDAVAWGFPPTTSTLGSPALHQATLTITSEVNSALPDAWFLPFVNFVTIRASNASISGTIPSSVSALIHTTTIDLSSNKLTGNLSQALVDLQNLDVLLLGNNRLTGDLPDLSKAIQGARPVQIDLSNNHFDLCGTPDPHIPSSWNSGSFQCAISGDCPTCTPYSLPWYYSNGAYLTFCSVTCNGAPASPLPTIPPTSALLCETPPPSVGNWTCDPRNGVWTSNSSVSSTTPLTISSSITIEGNLTASVIIITNVTSNAPSVVFGCANVSSVQLNLTSQDFQQIKSSSSKTNRTLLIQMGNNCTSIANTPITVVQSSSDSCDTISASPDSTSSSTLSVVLSLTNSCQPTSHSIWWIILVSVVGGVLVLAVIGALLGTFVRPIKYFFRPYTRPRADVDEEDSRVSAKSKEERVKLHTSEMYEPSLNSGKNSLYST